MSSNLVNSVLAFLAVSSEPSEVVWAYLVFGVVLAVGLAAIFIRGDWQKARGFDRLILFGPLFYAAPVAAFGTEHFTVTNAITSIVPAWIPWHHFWVYFVGACFIAGGLSLVTGIQARLAASLFALTFFLFVVLMHAPAWAQQPRNRFALAIVLRETSFSGGALALAASLTGQVAELSREPRERAAHIMAAVARYFVTVPVLFFSLEQFLHGDHAPGVPLARVTPDYILGRAIWTYLAAVVYAWPAPCCLLARKPAQPQRASV